MSVPDESSEPQLTARALLVGALLGALLCLSNLTVALRTGWSLGLTVTAGVAAWGLLRALRLLRVAPRPFGILENNTACSVASSAGFMAGGGNLAALPALLLLGRQVPSWWALSLWFALVAVLGIFLALPLRRQLIVVEELPFPTGTATAQTLRALHGGGDAEGSGQGASRGASQGARSARRLALSALLAAVAAWLRESPSRWVPLRLPRSLPWAGSAAARYTVGLDLDLLLVGAGALLGPRTALSILIGSLAWYGFVAPELVARGEVAEAGYRALLGWSLWPAAGLLLGASLTGLLLDGKQVLRALVSARHAAVGDHDSRPRWTALAFALLAPVLGALMVLLFGLPWWSALVALPLSVLMALIAARATGETDVTPTQALGPAAEIACGSLAPGHVAATAGLVGANLAAGVGLHAADLLTDLKAGHLLGARPRAQLVAQLLGAGVGALVVAPAFHFVVRNPALLGTPAMPAPSAMIWAAVARALEVGAQAIPPGARLAALAALATGALLTLAERAPGPIRSRLLPSPTGLGVALLLPASSSTALFAGALLAWLARRGEPDRQRTLVVPVASGLIAGESLAGLLGL